MTFMRIGPWRRLRASSVSLALVVVVAGLPVTSAAAAPETLVLQVHNTTYDGGDCSDPETPEQCNLRSALQTAALYAEENLGAATQFELLPGARYPVHFQLDVWNIPLLFIAGNGAAIDNPDAGGRAFAIAAGSHVEIDDLSFVLGLNNAGVNGGCIHNAGTLVLRDVTFDGCSGGTGGAVQTIGDLAIERGVFRNNTGSGSGGALAVDDGAWATVADSTFEGNTASLAGGAIHVGAGWLELTGSSLFDNTASAGGALRVVDRADITGSSLIRNTATDGAGGAVLFDADTEVAELLIDRTSIVDNQAITEGGAIWSDGNLTLTNSTLTRNRAGYGGALFQAGPNGDYGPGRAELTNATIAENTADVSYGGVHTDPGAEQTSVFASAIVGNGEFQGDDVGSDSNCHGASEFQTQMSVAYSVLGPNCAATDVGDTSAFEVTDPQFGELEFHGPAAVLVPLEGARVIDFVPEGCETVDQLGTARPQGSYCDAGAIEYLVGASVENVTVTLTPTVRAGATIVPLDQIPQEAFVEALADPTDDADEDSLVDLGLSNVGLSNVGVADAGLSNVGTSNPWLGDVRLIDMDLPFSLAQLPLLSAGGWGACTQHDVLLDSVPLQVLTMADLRNPGADPATRTCAGSLTLSHLDVANSALAGVGLLAAVAGDVPMAEIRLPGSTATTTTQSAADWCAALEAATPDASEPCLGLDPEIDSLTDASLVGAGLSNVGLSNVGLSNVGLSNVGVGSLGLSNVGLSNVGLSNVGLSNVGLSNVDLGVLGLSNVGLSNVGLSNVGLSNVGLSNVGLSNVDLGVAGLSNVGLSNVGLSNVGLSNVGLSNVGLSNVDLGALGLSNVGLSNVGLSNVGLSNVGAVAAGLSNVGLSNVGLSNVGAVAAGLSNVGLSNVGLSNVGLSNVPLGLVTVNALSGAGVQVNQLTNCTSCGGDTLAELAANGQLLNSATLATVWKYFEQQGSTLAILLTSGFSNRAFIESHLTVDDGSGVRELTLGEVFGGLTVQDLVDADIWQDATVGQLVKLLLGTSQLDALTIGDLIDAFLDAGVLTTMTLGELIVDLGDGAVDGITVGQLLAAISSAALDQVPLGEFFAELDPSLLDGLTLGDLFGALSQEALGQITLGDLLLALLTPADVPWQQIDLSKVDWSAYASDGDTADATVAWELSGAPGQIRVDVVVPAGFHRDTDVTPMLKTIDPEGLDITAPVADPTYDPVTRTFTWLLSGLLGGMGYELTFGLTAGLDLGTFAVSGTVTDVASAVSGSAAASTQVTEAFESNDTVDDLADVDGIAPTTLYFTTIGAQGDQDLFPIEVAAAQRVSLRLFGLPADADVDLALWRVTDADATSASQQTIPSGSAAGSTLDGNAATHQVEDIPPLAVPAGKAATLVAYSGRVGDLPEHIATTPLAAGRYIIQVFGYNQDTTIQHVALQAEVTSPSMAVPACATYAPLPYAGVPAAAGLTTPAAGTNTLFVYNPTLYAQAHGAGALTELEARMTDLGQRGDLGIVGALVPIDADTDVRAAYEAWHQHRCSVDHANAVAEAITDALDGLRTSLGGVANVVMVGDDFQLPYWRLEDHSPEAPQSSYASTFSGMNNEVVAAAVGNYYFSDDPYVSDTVVQINGVGQLHLGGAAIGRLVESHADITLALDNCLDHDCLLAPETVDEALVTGYHFLTDGANEVADSLQAGDAARVVHRLINDTWTATQLLADWLGFDGAVGRSTSPAPVISSINAHFSHLGLLTAIGDKQIRETGDDTHIADEVVVDVTEVGDVDAANRAANQTPDLDRRIVMSMGCNAGMSVSDIQLGSVDLRHLDWAQTVTSQGGSLLANAGFGYGDTDIVEYSERLYEMIAGNLDGAVTVGDAVRYAKHSYAARQFDEYEGVHVKVVNEVITYGLPMLRVRGDGVPGALPTPPPFVPTAPGRGTSLINLSFDPDPVTSDRPGVPDMLRTTTSRGEFWSIDGDVIGSRDNPLLPVFSRDATQQVNGAQTYVAHGVMPLSLTHVDVPGIDPHILRPIVADGTRELESQIALTGFPVRLATVAPLQTPTGPRDQLSFVAGRILRDPDGGGLVQRLFQDAQLEVGYAADVPDADWTRPIITHTRAQQISGTVHFDVDVTDTVGTVERVRVLYFVTGQPAPVTWSHVDLVDQGNGRWSASVAGIPEGQQVRYEVFAEDDFKNLGVSGAKGGDFVSRLVPPVSSEDASITLSPDVAQGATATGPVQITTVDAPAGASVYVDGVLVPSLPHTITGDGAHVVEVRDGSTVLARRTFVIDAAPPVADITSPVDGLVVLRGTKVPVGFVCSDAGSAPACSFTLGATAYGVGEVIDTSALAPGLHTATLTAVDGQGRTTTDTSTLRVVTFTAPSGPHDLNSITPYTVQVGGAPADARVDFGRYDDPSPLDQVTVSGEVNGQRTASYRYGEPGLYVVTLLVDGYRFAHEYAVVYDPSGSFVTGGGAIWSPRGALRSGPSLEGEATFGFVSQYKKGTSIPSGNTEFRFDAGGFRFKATAYEWLVVAGAKAKFKGIGEVNGAPGYGFMLTAEDGDHGGASRPDRLRMKVWRLDDPTVIVYDNQELMGGTPVRDDAELSETTALRRGSIVVHDRPAAKKK